MTNSENRHVVSVFSEVLACKPHLQEKKYNKIAPA